MAFKIVQTKEKGKNLLTIVPHLWESNEKIKWPCKSGQITAKEFKQMLLDKNSIPSGDWIEVKCRLKRDNLSYEQAVAETKVMSDQSDTEASDSMPPPSKPLPARRKVLDRENIGRPVALDFSSFVCQ